MKYEYNVKLEAFKRIDNRGKPLFVNVIEANRIVHLLNLGYSISEITTKVTLSNPKGTATTLNSFIRNYKQGNIEIPTDVPSPRRQFESMTDNDRLNSLEERVIKLEKLMENRKETTFNKVKSWLKD